MKRLKHNFKKGMAFVLSLAMVAGLVPAMSGGANTVQAATGSGTEPSVSAYATKTQLMDGTFAPNSSGEATNKGKLVFGKNSNGNPQEWYILGKDTGVSGDNTIIFAASPIATGKQFNSSKSNKTYNYEAGTGYGELAGNIEVYSNHYGASDLRVALQGMATNTNYFTTAELVLMNLTTVTTKDTNTSNGNVTYTTTDKLYALAADGYGSSYKTIKAGSSDSTVLAMNSYWSSGVWFWLRSPYVSDSGVALLAYTSYYCVNPCSVLGRNAVQPASNLNLSSVLFASAATAASSDTVSNTIASETAMTLRFDGTGRNIGTVTYNTTTGDIKAAKGTTSQTVALVVQGKGTVNGEEKDWYYSKQITGTDVVNVDDIVAESNTPASIDLSTCKIWLEITDSTENLTYAVNASVAAISEISSVAITDIDTPAANTTLDTSASCATTGVSSTTPQITWTPSDTTAGYNTSYTASIILTPDTFYEFANNVTATVLSYSATSVNKNEDGTLTVTYDFPATAKDKLTSITTPQAITVANGTAYDAMNLPATVSIVTEGNTVSSAPVTWNTTTPAGGSYDSSVLTEQTVTLNGTVTCPDSIDDNGIALTTTITITISAAGIVGAPTANPVAGTYTENQSVTLTSSTEGAKIYYTTDGSEPTLSGGVPGGTTTEYTAAIAVTGTAGQSITTTIKAIAVKSDMQDSSVGTFTYTIKRGSSYSGSGSSTGTSTGKENTDGDSGSGNSTGTNTGKENADEDSGSGNSTGTNTDEENTDEDSGSDTIVTPPKEGTLLTDSNTKMVYKVTKSGATGGTVQFVKTKNTKAKTITIPDKVTFDGITYKVTSIAANALKDNKTVTTVTIGKYVTSIGSNAFSGCTKLKKITIGKSVTTIGSKAFYKCTSLTGITIPSKEKKIGNYAFKGCSKLKKINLNTTLLTSKTVSDKAFSGVSTGAVVKVPASKAKAYKKLLVKKGLDKKVVIKKW